MALDRVTITGADDSTDPSHLAELSNEFSFVEWGILVSSSRSGGQRFPKLDWLSRLYDTVLDFPHMNLSLHVCGQWVRDICVGDWTPFVCNTGPIKDFVKRVQLNFHAYSHLLTPQFVPSAKWRCDEQGWQLIFQCDGVNDHLVSSAYDDGLDAVPLYDKSGGAGVVPAEWPIAMKGIYSGYAGGLGPDNLEEQLAAITTAANGEMFWVDMETKVRTPDDRALDFAAVRKCLEIAAPHVVTHHV